MAYVKMTPYIWIPLAPKIYGAEWGGASGPAWTRTNDAAGLSDPNPAVNNGNGNSPFDTIYPWKDMRRVEDSAAGTLVEIPKFYYKWVRNGAKMKLLITDTAADGFYVSPAHADRGDGKGERDVAYVGAYHCASDYKSKTGVLPLASTLKAEFRTRIHNLGSSIWQWDYAMYWTIGMLYLVEYAHWNSQLKIGYGCSDSGFMQNSGLCDSMIYHTGTNAASRTTYGHTRYRYIEDLWGNCYDMCDGIYFDASFTNGKGIYVIKNPSDFSDDSNGTKIGSIASRKEGCITSWNSPQTDGFEYALYVADTIGGLDYQTYICDTGNCFENCDALTLGGSDVRSQYRGLFCWSQNTMSSKVNSTIGSRLMKLP